MKKGDLASAPWLMKLERIGEVMPGETGPPYFMVIGLPDGTPDGGGSVAARGMPESARQLELWAPDVLISLLITAEQRLAPEGDGDAWDQMVLQTHWTHL